MNAEQMNSEQECSGQDGVEQVGPEQTSTESVSPERLDDVYSYWEGVQPLLVSVPHDGRMIPESIRCRMTAAGRGIPDTDWHVAELYSFVRDIGASMIEAKYSRYVVDLNRPASDEALYEGQVATGLCPTRTFAGDPLYDESDSIGIDEVASRTVNYWQPYHDKIAATLEGMHAEHGYALLWDAHSIPSRVPRLFDGELPELNFGSYDDRSCDPGLVRALLSVIDGCAYEVVSNERFKGGYITRHYGQPERAIHAVQLEIAQRAYMDEVTCKMDDSRTADLREMLRRLLDTFLTSANGLSNA